MNDSPSSHTHRGDQNLSLSTTSFQFSETGDYLSYSSASKRVAEGAAEKDEDESASSLRSVTAMDRDNLHGTSIHVDLFDIKSERFYTVCVHGSEGFVDLQEIVRPG